jgi:hypothetical protein
LKTPLRRLVDPFGAGGGGRGRAGRRDGGRGGAAQGPIGRPPAANPPTLHPNSLRSIPTTLKTAAAAQVASVAKGRVEFDFTPTADLVCAARGDA